MPLKQNSRLREQLCFVIAALSMALLSACDVAGSGGSTPSPVTAEDYYLQGESLNTPGDCPGAIESFSQAIKLKPDYWEALRGRGHCYLILGKYANAEEDYTASLKISPDPYSFEGRGDARMLQGEYDRAIPDYDEAIKLKPAFASAYQVRGFAPMLTGDLQRAADDCREAIKLDPNRAQTYLSCGETYLASGDYATAIQHFDKTISLDASLAEAYGYRDSLTPRTTSSI